PRETEALELAQQPLAGTLLAGGSCEAVAERDDVLERRPERLGLESRHPAHLLPHFGETLHGYTLTRAEVGRRERSRVDLLVHVGEIARVGPDRVGDAVRDREPFVVAVLPRVGARLD